MKKNLVLTLLALAAVSIKLHAAASALPALLPEFMDDAQAAKWSANKAATVQAGSSEPSVQFYTGKPYVADAGGYIYKYRTYNPEMTRWTTADPSGFPDGVNNHVYAPVPTTALDPNGLVTVTGVTTPNASSVTAVVNGTTYTITAFGITQSNVSSALVTVQIDTFTAETYVSNGNTYGGVILSIEVTGDNSDSFFSQQIRTTTPQINPDGTPVSYAGSKDANGLYTYNDGNQYVYPGPNTPSSFYDEPGRIVTSATPGNPVIWNGALSLISGNINYGTFAYGFTITE